MSVILRHLAMLVVCIFAASPVALITAAPAAAQIIDSANYVHPDELRKRAEKGDVQAMRKLQERTIFFKNPKKKKEPEQRENITREERLKWIRAGAAAGDPNSQARLARILGKGSVSATGYAEDDFSDLAPLDYAESARLARSAAAGFRQRDAGSGFTGMDNRKKLDEAAAYQEEFAQQSDDLALLLPLAEAGDKEAMWGVYLVHAAAGNSSEIWDWLAISRKAGDPRATIETWRRSSWTTKYKGWENGKPNAWLVRAANLGDPQAMNSMGNAYAWNTDDHAAAHAWYKRAHEAGSPLAEVGMYLYGDPKALAFFKAAEAGSGASAYGLAQYYLSGEWDGRNTGEYERWMQKAVQLRHTEALWEWGLRTRDSSLIRAAANAGHAEAKREVSRLDMRAAEETRRLRAEADAKARGDAEAIYATLRSGNTYAMNGISHERLYAALQAAQTDAERALVEAESSRRVAEYNAAASAASAYRPVRVTPYVPQTTYKTDSDYRQELRDFKRDLDARIRAVTERP